MLGRNGDRPLKKGSSQGDQFIQMPVFQVVSRQVGVCYFGSHCTPVIPFHFLFHDPCSLHI